MKAVKKALHHFGINSVDEMETNQEITIKVDGYTDLTIEKISENQVSVAHYYTQMGDIIRDPEIVYRVSEDGNWTPIEYTQDPGIYQRDETGLSSVEDVAETWDRNLRKQGFIDAAQQRGEPVDGFYR